MDNCRLIVDGFSRSSLPVGDHTAPPHSCTIPVNHVARLMGMDRDALLWVSTFPRLLVLAESHLERSLGHPDVGLMVFFTEDLVDHSSLPFFRDAGLDLHQDVPEGPHWLEDCLYHKGSAYSPQLLAESLNIGETHSFRWVLTRRFRGRGSEKGGSARECLLH